MTLVSPSAGVLVVLAFAAYWVAPPRWRTSVLLVASVTFYASSGFRGAAVALALAAATYVAGRMLEARRTRGRLAASVALVLGTLAVFKYLPMIAGTLVFLAGLAHVRLHLTVPSLPMPVGLSFICFGLVHFLVEVYRGAPVLAPLRFATYVAFFPTVTIGPIKSYASFSDDLALNSGQLPASSVPAEEGEPDEDDEELPRVVGLADGPGALLAASVAAPSLDLADVREGLTRIVIGLFRKFVIADMVVGLASMLGDPKADAPILVVAIAAYTVRIYFDFAGYSDIAIGVSRLFGFRIMENFDRPYLQRNLSEFWSHWHMSLTRFITEYVFIPLGGSRRGRVRVAMNTLVAMCLSGLWHGAGWNFVVWGLYHGLGLVVARWWRAGMRVMRARIAWLDRLAGSDFGAGAGWVVGWSLTLVFVALGWVLFALQLPQAIEVYARLLGAVPGEATVWMQGMGWI